MLNITTIKGATAAKSYYGQGGDYYIEDRAVSPSWHGKLRDRLGLPEELHHNHFIALCDNLNPHTGKPLTGAVKDDRDIGRDFTWSPSKSVTLAGLVGGDERVIEAVNESVREAMGVIEADTMTRVRKGNVHEERRTGEMLWAMFPHLTTRPIKGEVDPQYHIHAVVFNLTHDPVERELKAIQFREVKRNAPYYQAVFQSKLAGKLQDMGYGIRKTKDAFEITTVPERAIKEFSRRRALIEKVVEDYGFTNPESIAKLGAKTRERKAEGQPWAKLLEGWEKRLSAQELDALRLHPVPIHARTLDRSAQSVDYALKHLLERSSSVSQRELAKEALRYGMGDVTVEGVFKAIGKADLIRREVDGRLMVSSREVLNEENALVRFAIEGRGKFRPLRKSGVGGITQPHPKGLTAIVAEADRMHPATLQPFAQPVSLEPRAGLEPATNRPRSLLTPGAGLDRGSALSDTRVTIHAAEASPDTVTLSSSQQAAIKTRSNNFPHADQGVADSTPPLASPESNLSPTQRSAAIHVWNSPDRIIILRGFAGTGKTFLTTTILSKIDLPTIMLAPSSEASRGGLRREGFEGADTLARFLVDDKFQEQARNGLVWLDEASLAGGHDMARLVKLVDSLNARLVLSGDPRQHKSVARGDILTLLEEKAGLPAASVSEIQRQRGNYRKAVEKLAKGEMYAGFVQLDDLGWVHPMCPEDKYGDAAREYVQATKANESVLLVCPTHKEGAALTERVRKEMGAAGLLTGEERTFEVLTPTNWTEAERSDHRNYQDGHVLRYVRNGGGVRSGTKLDFKEGMEIKDAGAFQVYRRETINVRAGDTLRITANQQTKDDHKLNNGSTYQVRGFTKDGDIELNNGWKLGKDSAMFTHGSVLTSYAAQGKTVDRVIVVQGDQSQPASSQAQFYVSVSRGRKQASIYVDSKNDTLEAIKRDDKRLLASDLVRKPRKKIREKLKRHIAYLRQLPTLIGSKAKNMVMGRGKDQISHGYE
ncbi:MobF family relaxase [Zavarzinella formosa]|uniref:MobF family relaxase n=1 Tax=Zavarzinella formosa TaxID=360055 RepID=UPI0002E3DB6E|nr:MobF family relaxase [Zavarzinella formosa]